MTTKKITLNADKRKVIADQFQSFYEEKVKDKLIQAKEQYDAMREKAKVAIERVVRFHQPQDDVDTIRSMIKNTIEQVANCMRIIAFMFNDQLLKLMTRVENMSRKMKFMSGLIWVEILQEHIIEMR